MPEYQHLLQQRSSMMLCSIWSKHVLTPVALLERIRSVVDRASRKTVNQVTAKKKVKMIRVIDNTVKAKLPSTKWIGD